MLMTTESLEPRATQNYYVLLTEPNREMTAQANLIIRRVPFYLPTIFRARRISQKQHAARATHPDIPIALFPRMLFVAEDILEGAWELIKSAPGMVENPFLKFGEQYAVLRPIGMAMIVTIEADERQKYFSRKRKIGAPSWIPELGAEVSFLLDEVLGGLRGKVAGVDEKGRITILTEIMKRTVRVKATANQIEPV